MKELIDVGDDGLDDADLDYHLDLASHLISRDREATAGGGEERADGLDESTASTDHFGNGMAKGSSRPIDEFKDEDFEMDSDDDYLFGGGGGGGDTELLMTSSNGMCSVCGVRPAVRVSETTFGARVNVCNSPGTVFPLPLCPMRPLMLSLPRVTCLVVAMCSWL